VIGVITIPASTHIMFGYSSSPKSLIVLDVTSHGFHTTKNITYFFNCIFRNKDAIAERDKARLRVVQDPTEENKRMLAIRQRGSKRIIRMNNRLWEKKKVKDIEKNRKNNTRIFFEKANEVRRSFKLRHTMIRMEDGTLLTERHSEYNNNSEGIQEHVKILNGHQLRKWRLG